MTNYLARFLTCPWTVAEARWIIARLDTHTMTLAFVVVTLCRSDVTMVPPVVDVTCAGGTTIADVTRAVYTCIYVT